MAATSGFRRKLIYCKHFFYVMYYRPELYCEFINLSLDDLTSGILLILQQQKKQYSGQKILEYHSCMDNYYCFAYGA